MKRFFPSLSIILSAGIFFACTDGSSIHQNDNPSEPETFVDVQKIPDSLLTVDQLALKNKLIYIMAYKLDVRGCDAKLAVDRNYFIDNEIPVEYYDILSEQFDRNLIFLDNIKKAKAYDTSLDFDSQIESEYKEMQQQYRSYLEEYNKSGITYTEYIQGQSQGK